MSLRKEKVLSQVSVLESGHIEYRYEIRVVENNSVIGMSYERGTIEPGDDVAAQPERIRKIAGVVHTPDVVAAHRKRTKALGRRPERG